MVEAEAQSYISSVGSTNTTPKLKEILYLIDTYRYMTKPQICRKIWGKYDRNSRNQFSKHFSQTKIQLLRREGRLKEYDGVYSTHARGRGAPHQIAIVDVLLDLEAKAESQSFGFFFAYDPVHEKLKPDATVIFTDGNRCLLCYIEVHRETQDESVLDAKLERYRELARGDRFKDLWNTYASRYRLPKPRAFGFKVLICSKKKRNFPHPRFISILLGQDIPEEVF